MKEITPATNPFIFGADDLIKRCLADPKSQGILLTGPKGVGKMTLAYHLARSLFLKSCPAVDAQALFDRIAAQGHGDLKVIQSQGEGEESKKRKSDISIEAIRSVVHFTHVTSREGGWRIVIIDSIDDLGLKAANALLKTLEEPPKQTLIFLIAHSLGSVLPTLRSRCALYRLAPLSQENMMQALQYLLPEVSPEERAFLIQHAEGCPGRALYLKSWGGLAFYASFLQAIKNLIGQDLRPIYALLQGLKAEAEVYNAFFSFFLGWWSQGFTILDPDFSEKLPLEKEVLRLLRRKYKDYFAAEVHQYGSTLLRQISDFNLDPRQVLLSFFYELMTERLTCTIKDQR